MNLRATLAIAAIGLSSLVVTAQEFALPRKEGSIKFAVLGDTGTGGTEQTQIGAMLGKWRQQFPFDFALLLGDNMYGSERPQDYKKKFETPFKPLLDAKVEFHATLGNHDDQNQRFYKPFNLGGERYRTFKKGNVRFYVIDSNYFDPEQAKWLERELLASGTDWKIPYFHHPLYTSATRGPNVELRNVLEPLFIKYGVDVVLTGHEHIYERTKPQKGIYYFVAGGSAKLRSGDIRKSDLTEVGFDRDRSFMLMEVIGDELYFQAFSRLGATIDKGVIKRREVRGSNPEAPPKPKPAPARSATPPPAGQKK